MLGFPTWMQMYFHAIQVLQMRTCVSPNFVPTCVLKLKRVLEGRFEFLSIIQNTKIMEPLATWQIRF